MPYTYDSQNMGSYFIHPLHRTCILELFIQCIHVHIPFYVKEVLLYALLCDFMTWIRCTMPLVLLYRTKLYMYLSKSVVAPNMSFVE